MSEPVLTRIENLWRQALNTAWHGAGCSCHGSGTVVVLSAAELEADLIEYLLPRYEKADAREPVDALKQRQTAMANETFPVWLQSTAITSLPAPTREALFSDIENSLRSFCDDNSPAHHR